jgi:PAS domain S-box-containing protein
MKSGDSMEPSGFTDGLFQLHPTLDALSTFIYVKDRDLRIVSANRAFCDALGVSREKLLGMTTDQYLGEADSEAARIDREVIESGVARLGVVESFRAADGLHLVATDKAPVRAPDGTVVGLVGSSIDITAQRESDERLRQSEAQLRFLTDNTADVIWTMDLKFHTTYISPSVERVLGFTPDEWMQLPFDRMSTPESVEREFAALQRELTAEASGAADPHRTFTIEVEMNHKDGSTVWMEMVIRAIRDDTGKLFGMIGVSRDITGRMRAEKALKESEEKHRALFEQSLVPIGLISPEGQVLDANPAWLKMFGMTHADLSSFSARDFYVAPDGRDRFLKTIAADGRVEDEVQFRRKDGTVVDCRRTAAVLRAPDGSVFGFQNVILDDTSRKQAERELHESEQKYRELFEQSVDAINLVAVDGRIIDANPAWFALFGYTPDDIASYNATDAYVEPEGRTRFLQRIAAQDTVEDELQFRRKDGSIFDCHRVVAVRRAADGSIVGYQTVFHDVTETRKAERALRESEDRYRTLMTNLNDVVYEVDAGGRLTFVSPRTLEITGYAPEDVLGRPFSDFVHPEDLPRVADHWRGVTSGAVDPVEFRMLKPGGKPHFVRISGRAIMRNGRFDGSTGIMTDIDREVEARNALHESEEKFRALFEQSVAPISLITQDGCLIEANDAWFRLLGYSRKDMASFNAADLFPSPEMRDDFVRLLLKAGSLDDYESRIRTKDGTLIDVLRSITVRYNPDGSVLGFQTVLRDVTAEKAAEQALRESEEKYRQLFNQSIAAISLLAPDGHLIDANDAWFRLFGYSREDAPSIRAVNLYPTAELREESVSRLLSSGTLVDDEARVKKKDGTLIDALRSMVVRHNPDGSVLGYQTVWLDITELNLIRDELLDSREQLRRLALRIQEARENERTAIAQELHDHFGQELTALRLDLESLASSPPPAGDAGLIRIRGILQLVDQMSQELRRVISEMRPGMLDDLGLCAAIEWQAGQFSERTGIACNLILTANDANLPPSVSTALFRTFQELLSNVAQYAGATYVDASLISDSECVYLAVVDNGRGLTDEELHSSSSLGILGIQERIRACGGNVTFQGEPGKGTTVTVTIPLPTDAADGWQTRLGLR